MAALSVAVLAVTGTACGVEGADDEAAPTTAPTTAPAADDPTTTEAAGPSTSETDVVTTTSEDVTTPDDPVDPGDLEALLPTEDDLPSNYARQPDEDEDDDEDADDDDLDAAMEAACPDAAVILDANDDDDANDDAEVSRTFETVEDQSVEITIRPANDREVDVEALIAAYNDCDVLETELGGNPTTIDFSADTLDRGDDGAQLVMDMVVSYEGQDYDVSIHGFLFRRDGISVQVSAQSGLLDDGTTVPGDVDVAELVAERIDDAIQDR